MLTKVVFCMKDTLKLARRMVLFHVFANLFMSGLKKDNSYLLLHFNLLQWIVLLEVCEENPASQRYVVRKRRNVLKTLSENVAYPPLIKHKKSICSGSFLKFNCSVVSETTLMNLDFLLVYDFVMYAFTIWDIQVIYIMQIFQMLAYFIKHCQKVTISSEKSLGIKSS